MKKFLAVMLAGAMVLAMAGCSGGNSSSGSTANPAAVTAENSGSDVSDAADVSGAETDSTDTGAQDGTVLANPMKPDLISTAIQSSLGLDEAAATAAAEEMLPLLMYTEGNPARIAKVLKKLQSGEEVTVAFLGGSITQGTGADNENCYAALTAKWIAEQ